MARGVMVDIESLDTRPSGAILSIGALVFDPVTGGIGETLYRNILTDSCTDLGLTIDPDTEAWWSRQSAEARAVLEPGQVPLTCALADLGRFYADACAYSVTANVDGGSGTGACEIWCNGASFDFPMLAHAYRVCSLPLPWQFRQERDVRTVLAVAGDLAGFKKPNHRGIAHSALDDAMHQAQIVIACFDALRTRRDHNSGGPSR